MKSLIAQTLIAGFALATVGCSATKGDLTKQLDVVKREITTLRAQSAALKDRIDMLETTPSKVHAGAGVQEDDASDRPALEVVHLGPEEAPAEASPVVSPPLDHSPPMEIVGDDQGVEEVDPSDPKAKTTKSGYPKAPKKRGR